MPESAKAQASRAPGASGSPIPAMFRLRRVHANPKSREGRGRRNRLIFVVDDARTATTVLVPPATFEGHRLHYAGLLTAGDVAAERTKCLMGNGRKAC
jgi:hypothetical protein